MAAAALSPTFLLPHASDSPLACGASAARRAGGMESPPSSSVLGPAVAPVASCPNNVYSAWTLGSSGTWAVRLGSGLGATAVGVHLAATSGPWLDLPLPVLPAPLRLDLGLWLLASSSPVPEAPSAPISCLWGLGLGWGFPVGLEAADLWAAPFALLLALSVAAAFLAASWRVLLACPLGPTRALQHLTLGASPLLRMPAALWQALYTAAECSCTQLPRLPTLLARMGQQGVSQAVAAVLLSPSKSDPLRPPAASGQSAAAEAQAVRAESQDGGEGAEQQVHTLSRVWDWSQALASVVSRGIPLSSGPRARPALALPPGPEGQGPLSAAQEPMGRGGRELCRESALPPQSSVTEADLEMHLRTMSGADATVASRKWELIVDKSGTNVAYKAWRRDPEDGGPTEYKTWTRFSNSTALQLCAFYLDCQHLATWEPMLKSCTPIHFCPDTAQETVCLVKQYPLCRPREYVLGWRVWKAVEEGPTPSYYCVTKNVEHAAAPHNPQGPRRVGLYRCSWRVREALALGEEGGAEAEMYLQEDSGMQRGMAKLAFRRGIWAYVQRTAEQLRQYKSMCEEGTQRVSRELHSRDIRGRGSCPEPKPVPLSLLFANEFPAHLAKDYLSQQSSERSGDLPRRSCDSDFSEASNSSSPCSDSTRAQAQLPLVGPDWRAQVCSKVLPVLAAAAAAGLGTLTFARGPLGFLASALLATSAHVGASSRPQRIMPLRMSKARPSRICPTPGRRSCGSTTLRHRTAHQCR